MKYSILLAVLLAACGDSGCEITEYRVTENGVSKRCIIERCGDFKPYIRCF
jgi:hypothetical protein